MTSHRPIGHFLLAIFLIVACAVSSFVQVNASQDVALISQYSGHGHSSTGQETPLTHTQVADADLKVASTTAKSRELAANEHCCVCPVHGMGLAAPDMLVRFTRTCLSVRAYLGSSDLMPADIKAEALPKPPKNLA